MNSVKKLLGIVWMLLGPAAILFMIWQAVDKISLANSQATLAMNDAARELAKSAATNTMLQWSIIIAVFLPVAFAMVIFGKYALAGEYSHLPQSSNDMGIE